MDWDEFTRYLRFSGRGKATKTVDAYLSDVRQFLSWLSKDVVETTEEDIIRFKEHLVDDLAMTNTSLNRKLSALRSLFAYLKKRGAIAEDPMDEIQNEQVQTDAPVVALERSVVRDILDAPATNHVVGQRDRAILYMLAFTGIRRDECCKLKVANLNDDLSSMVVLGKRGKKRAVPIIEPARSVLRDYLEAVRPRMVKGEDEGWVFLSTRGGKMDVSTLWRVTTKYAETLGTQAPPHRFRHSFATELNDSDVNIRYIQELLGHANIATTQRYTHANVKRIGAKLEAINMYS